MDRCTRCGEPYVSEKKDVSIKAECPGCGLSAEVPRSSTLTSPYSPEDVLHYEMTKIVAEEMEKAEVENKT